MPQTSLVLFTVSNSPSLAQKRAEAQGVVRVDVSESLGIP